MWIPSKLIRPSHSQHSITRPRLLKLLRQASNNKLVLFRSPAGYGKTTIVTQWLADKTHVGWFSIDINDNDEFYFMSYLVQALNKATKGHFEKVKKLTEKRQYHSPNALVSEIVAVVTRFKQPCYLVLDDYHLIKNLQIHESMRFFLKHIPDNLTLIVTSRAALPLGTASLRVNGLLLEIDSSKLAFNQEETLRFFNQRNNKVNKIQARDICHYVEGWPSALQLIALQTPMQSPLFTQDVITSYPFDPCHVWDYLMEEVFELLDSDIQHFLMQVSVLEHFNEKLVLTLTQRSDSLSMLESLNRYGLFIYPLEGEQNWYRFHNLFAEFLSHQRLTRLPQMEKILHHQAALAWVEQENPYRALAHAQQTKDSDLIIEILEGYGWKMFHRGALTELESAIDQLDRDLLYHHPKLSILQAWLAQSQHRFDQVSELLSHAEVEHLKRNITLGTNYQGQSNALLAQVAINSNDPQRALILAEQALSQLDSTVYLSRIVAISVIGEVNHVLGRLDQALSIMQQTEKLARQHQVYHQVLWAILQQSEIMIARSDFQTAYELQNTAFRLIEEQQLQHIPLHEFLLRLRAQLYCSWNQLDEAEVCIQKGLSIIGENQSNHLHCYSMLARISLLRGDVDSASTFVEHIQRLMQHSLYHADWIANASLSLLLYWQEKKDTKAIQSWLDQAIKPKKATNHFQQLQWRNVARAYISLHHWEKARQVIDFLKEEATRHQLLTDSRRNSVIEAVLTLQQSNEQQAISILHKIIDVDPNNIIIGELLYDKHVIGHLFAPLIEAKKLKRKVGRLTESPSTHNRHKTESDISFSQALIKQLLKHPDIPNCLKTSPLTQREWQVLGLIYSGVKNEQIALKLEIAGTTVKTHIRNLYQKLSITERKQAIQIATQLLRLTQSSSSDGTHIQ
ncbi:HTH-type transcriptional regulator MalT [Vibrio sagamiensis]|uniref:HTH-type transcriptional regulator MalT n=1 Tax=Vibrio sagamiensis NBRC 104589 TaxID=1219064 RepID=A0A511QDC2_9VIBR|nr:HTH-type transcriptional regulator MalT [Vibrio sagamiensis]PNQ65185.1 HTH-type transcriptional regulator MalT [Vibrio agarivorans]GEM75304.1 HTH-type transcriptional regulator MalT [Vibrio sagamiensis NBRC 104589]